MSPSPIVLELLRFGLDVALKATVLLAAAEILLILLRRAPASLRHTVTTLALAGAVALPVLTLLLPRWQLPLVPSLLPEKADAVVVRREAPRPSPAVSERTESSADFERNEPSESAERAAAASSSQRPSSSFVHELRAPAAPPRPRTIVWMPWLLLLWGLGTAVALARLWVGSARVASMACDAKRVLDLDWVLAKEELSAKLGLTRPVELLASDRVPVAMTSGLRRPLLFVAANADRWPAERRRVVLLHELAHVQRRDWVALLLAEVARALYWFHPLVWIAVGQSRRDCEKACDDIVLGAGTKPSVYAAHLLGIVRALQAAHQQLLPAVPMARPSQFEGRMRAILDAKRPRRGLSIVEKALAVTGVVGAVLAVAAVEPWAKCPEQRTAFFRRAEIAPVSAFLGLIPVSTVEREESAKPKVVRKHSCPFAPDTVPAVYPSAPARSEPAAAPLRASVPGDGEEISEGTKGGVAEGVEPGVAGGAEEGIRKGIEGGMARIFQGFEKASHRKDKSGSDWFSRGKKLHDDGKYEEAIEAFRRSIELGYREGTASYNIACGYARLHRSAEAVEWLQRAMDSGFNVAHYINHDDDLDSLRDFPAFRELSHSLTRDKSVQAEAEFERLSNRPSAHGSAFYQVGKRLLSVGSYDAAARAFGKSADSGYRVGSSLYNEACALSLAGRRQDALNLLEKSLLAGFDDTRLLRYDSDLDNLRSEKGYSELVGLSEDLSLSGPNGVHDAFGLLKYRWRKALPRYEEIVTKHPQIGRAWFNLGFVQLRAENYAAASKAFERALALGYRKPTTMYNLACAHSLAGEKDQAFQWLFQALDAGFDGYHSLRHDSDLDHIRHDARFREALEKAEQQKIAEKN